MEGHYNYMSQPGFYSDDHSPIVSPAVYGSHMHQLNTLSTENLSHYPGFEDALPSLISPVEGSKSKRRQAHALDHVKHKRTRSGCFTCRARRVKCDEKQPTCDRCLKGQRDCVYPDANNQRPPKDLSKYKTAATDGGSSGDELESNEKLPSIPDEEQEDGSGATLSNVKLAHDSMSPSSKERTPHSPPESSKRLTAKRPPTSKPSSKQPKVASLTGPKWASLPKDIKGYLKYHRDNITCHHYALKHDNNNFLKTTFLEIALSYEPLLYAITAFSAYFHTLARPDGKIQTFLSYYNKSVSLLRETLAKASRHSTATLLTILQLATFEEYLGDWVNVFNHSRAANEILTQLFTPETIMQNETRRKIVSWYMRFDILTGFVSGFETVLAREWYEAVTDYYVRQVADKPQDLECRIEETFAKTAFLAFDIALLFGRMAKGVVPLTDIMPSMAALRERIQERDAALTSAFADSRTYVKDFPNAPADGWIDLFGATRQDFLITEPSWSWNLVLMDWYAIKLMFLGQLYQMDKSSISPLQLTEVGYKICQLFEGVELSTTDKQRDVLAVHGSLGIAMTTLPRDEAHMLWCRRKFALVASCGYHHPASMRTRMSEAWQQDLDEAWWHAEETTPILQQIREFISYRALNPNDAQTDSLRDLRPVFKAMSLEDDPHKNSGGLRSNSSSTNTDEQESVTSADLWPSLESSPEMSWDASTNSAELTQSEWTSPK